MSEEPIKETPKIKTHKDIKGYFAFEGFYSYFAENFLKNDSTIVEIGAYLGQSTAFMARQIKDKKLNTKFYVVDHWRGSDGIQSEVDGDNLYNTFLQNMKDCEVDEIITIVKKDSLAAASDFPDKHFDLIFIDAAHDYPSVTKDINAWLPKLKDGGIIGGDDYHPAWFGVVKAVDEIFGDKVQKDLLQAWYVKL
jgi:hypothetical protein